MPRKEEQLGEDEDLLERMIQFSQDEQRQENFINRMKIREKKPSQKGKALSEEQIKKFNEMAEKHGRPPIKHAKKPKKKKYTQSEVQKNYEADLEEREERRRKHRKHSDMRDEILKHTDISQYE